MMQFTGRELFALSFGKENVTNDHSEFQAKAHVPMINLSVQIVANISIAGMLQWVLFLFKILYCHLHVSLTQCISFSICKQ